MAYLQSSGVGAGRGEGRTQGLSMGDHLWQDVTQKASALFLLIRMDQVML